MSLVTFCLTTVEAIDLASIFCDALLHVVIVQLTLLSDGSIAAGENRIDWFLFAECVLLISLVFYPFKILP